MLRFRALLSIWIIPFLYLIPLLSHIALLRFLQRLLRGATLRITFHLQYDVPFLICSRQHSVNVMIYPSLQTTSLPLNLQKISSSFLLRLIGL